MPKVAVTVIPRVVPPDVGNVQPDTLRPPFQTEVIDLLTAAVHFTREDIDRADEAIAGIVNDARLARIRIVLSAIFPGATFDPPRRR